MYYTYVHTFYGMHTNNEHQQHSACMYACVCTLVTKADWMTTIDCIISGGHVIVVSCLGVLQQ